MKIALAQIEVRSGEVTANTQKMIEHIEKAKVDSNDVVLFPEMTDTGYDMNVILKKASEWNADVLPALCQAAKKYEINVVAGISEKTSEGVFNSVASVNRRGELTGSYRKTHLVTAEPMLEHKFLKAGNKLGLLEIDGIKVGIMTCYEIRFPEIARSLALMGAELIIIPAAWPLVRLPHWQSLIAARAIENQVFVAGVNRLGNDNGIVFAGTSMVVSPYGNILTSGSQIHEALLTSEIDLPFIKTVRAQIKVYQDRRTELYQEILK